FVELREEAAFAAVRICAMEVLLAVEEVDVLLREPELQQVLDGRPRVRVVGKGPHHAIGRIRDEVVRRTHVAGHGHGGAFRLVGPDYIYSVNPAGTARPVAR